MRLTLGKASHIERFCLEYKLHIGDSRSKRAVKDTVPMMKRKEERQGGKKSILLPILNTHSRTSQIYIKSTSLIVKTNYERAGEADIKADSTLV